MKRIPFIIPVFILLLCIANLSAYSQADNTVRNNITAKLKAFSAAHITEKAYLHFDKPYYAAGDTIYFKAYVTMGERHELSKISGVLHVDLVNTNNKVDQSIKLPIADGVTHGDFALPDSLPKGNYRIRAYTQWMRNNSEDAFFDQLIPLGSAANNKSKHPAVVSAKPDMQFFPEGGELVAGIQTKVAFKAIGANGLGIDVKGTVTDDAGNEVANFTSEHLGIGYFYFTPADGKTYKASLTYGNGIQDIEQLPAISPKGISLAITDSVGKYTISINSNKAYCQENRDKPIYILIYEGGLAATIVSKLDSTLIKFDVQKRHLHSGVMQVTLFSENSEPLSERLVFVQNPDQVNLTVNTDKTSYSKREKVQLSIHAANRLDSAVSGHFSVSVIDESKVPIDENDEHTILNYLLLTSDLKGYIEQPNYYFTDVNDKTRADLDLVMLTHGYRRFEWKQLLNNSYPQATYQPEQGLEISGMVKSLFGKSLANSAITLLPAKGGQLLTSVSDDKGIFHFNNLAFTDTVHFVLNAVKANGANSTKISYFNKEMRPAVVLNLLQNTSIVKDTVMAAYLNNDKIQQDELVKHGVVKLKEVKIRIKKLDDNYRTQSLAGPGHADQVMHADQIGQIQGQLSTSLNGRLRMVVFLGPKQKPFLTGGLGRGPMLVIVDGVEGVDISDLSANDVETVEVLKGATASIYGMAGGNGVLIITTKQGDERNDDAASIGVLPIAVNGFYKVREFYSPKYDASSHANSGADLRSTIFWQPEVVPDKDGNASFDYYNADGTGNYRVVIEGIDEKGNIGRQVYRYKVE
jgi:TonB-dependent SusC/RagA subfamily outer membrane receptor